MLRLSWRSWLLYFCPIAWPIYCAMWEAPYLNNIVCFCVFKRLS